MLIRKGCAQRRTAPSARHSRFRNFLVGSSAPFHRMSLMIQTTLLCALLSATALVSMGTPAWGSSSPSAPAAPGIFPVHPGPHGYFEYTLAAGASATGSIVVHNLTASPVDYLLYITGATTSPAGGVAYGQAQAKPYGAAAWIQLSMATVHVLALGAVQVDFTLLVPGATVPGDYVAGLAAETPTATPTTVSNSAKGGVTLLATTRVIVAVVVHVPGPAAAAARFGPPSVGLQQHRRQVLTIPIDDTGNILMKPYLAGVLRSCAGGQVVLSLSRRLDTFVPHTSIDYPWYLNSQVLPAGCYRASLALDLGAGGTRLASYTGTLQVGVAATDIQRPPGQRNVSRPGVPTWLISVAAGAALLLLLAALLLLRARAERRRLLERLANEDAPASPRSG